MADHQCVAIKSSDGVRCSKRATVNGRCGTHNGIVVRDGPNYTELVEVDYRFKNRRKILNKQNNDELHALGPQPWLNAREQYGRLLGVHAERMRTLNGEQAEMKLTVITRQRADIARTGIDPDAVQEARRERDRLAQVAANAARNIEWQQIIAERQQRMANNALQNQQAMAAGVGAAQHGVGLAGFANDRQNIHTTIAVKQTLKVVTQILKIDVPIEYQWNMRTVSKTMSEIISECELSPASAWQMVAKYCSDEQIYELQPGIYGKVLDCVWQYIKNSSDKDDLKKILKSEMKDNIGMCAQGNLSRLTNILSGYLDGVVIEESMTSKLGRMLPMLMEESDLAERLYQAGRIFVEVGLPEDQWSLWAQELIADQAEDDYREMCIRSGRIEFLVYT